jgi:hypothetical protein
MRTECKLWHIGRFDALSLEVLASPFDELYAIHARHLLVDYYERNLVLFFLTVKI